MRAVILVLLISLCSPALGYAAGSQEVPASAGSGVKLIKSYPHEDEGGFEPVNMNVKLWFDKDVLDPSVQETNSKAFSITNSSGSALAFDVLYNVNKGHISLLLKEDLVSDTEYTVTIKNSLQAVDGSTFGKNQTLHFRTRDVNASNFSSMAMMMVMVVVMVGATMFQSKRSAEKEAQEKNEKVNPYKVAKEKNTTVEQVLKETQKNQNKKKKPITAAKTDEADRVVKTETGGSPARIVPKGPANKGKTSGIRTLTKK